MLMSSRWLAIVVLLAVFGCQQTSTTSGGAGAAGTAASGAPATTSTSTTSGAPATTGTSTTSGADGASSGASEVTLPGGLKYLELKVGDGAIAENGQSVSVHYTGWLTNGTKFDSSVDRGQPFNFQLGAGQVIRGWDEGVKGMRVGGKRKLTIPSDLGYGPQGTPGGPIPPNATLVFDVELLGVR